ncbi:hypothetical protein G5I_00750 [Acromyrmex echinatior]|uniref:Uncharacterized protein n=1 Tax=Acromyrmex echinatior TaxID=103372 RepID=F4W5Q2_ACREC|nr:hypothetical protein G5I_00750 [Acromyrmex echinatior]
MDQKYTTNQYQSTTKSMTKIYCGKQANGAGAQPPKKPNCQGQDQDRTKDRNNNCRTIYTNR